MLVLVYSGDDDLGIDLADEISDSTDMDAEVATLHEIEGRTFLGEAAIVVLSSITDDDLREITRTLDDSVRVALIGRTEQRSIGKTHWRFFPVGVEFSIVAAEICLFVEHTSRAVRESGFLFNAATTGAQSSKHSTQERTRTQTVSQPVAVAEFGLSDEVRDHLFENEGVTHVPRVDLMAATVGLIHVDRKNVEEAFDFAMELERGVPKSIGLVGDTREAAFFAKLFRHIPEIVDARTGPAELRTLCATLRLQGTGPRFRVQDSTMYHALLAQVGCIESEDYDFVVTPFDQRCEGPTVAFVSTARQRDLANQNGIRLVVDVNQDESSIRKLVWAYTELIRHRAGKLGTPLSTFADSIRRTDVRWLLSMQCDPDKYPATCEAIVRDMVDVVSSYKTRDGIVMFGLCNEPDERAVAQLAQIRAWRFRDQKGRGTVPKIHLALVELTDQHPVRGIQVACNAAAAAYSAKSETILRVSVMVEEKA